MTPAKGGIPMKATPMTKPIGAPKGNRNALRHGLRAGKLPKDCRYLENRINEVRRNLEDAVTQCHGSLSIEAAAYIQTALRWETHAALAQRYLTKDGAKLTPSDKLHFSREIANASANRDRAIAMLELGTAHTSVVEALYSRIESKGVQS